MESMRWMVQIKTLTSVNIVALANMLIWTNEQLLWILHFSPYHIFISIFFLLIECEFEKESHNYKYYFLSICSVVGIVLRALM